MLCKKHRKKTQFHWHNADSILEDPVSFSVEKYDSKERCPVSIKRKELTLLSRGTSEYFLPTSSLVVSNECNYLNCDRASAQSQRLTHGNLHRLERYAF